LRPLKAALAGAVSFAHTPVFSRTTKHAAKTEKGRTGTPFHAQEAVACGLHYQGSGRRFVNGDPAINRRFILTNQTRRSLCCAIAALPLSLTCARAADPVYPTHPIKIIVTSAAGGLIDIASREFAEKMAVYLGQPIVVEDLPGASSSIAAHRVTAAPADGYTLLAFADTLIAAPYLSKSAGYDVEKDFTGIGELAKSPLLLVVSGDSPIKSLAELIRLAKQKPGKITYGSTGIGGTSHLSTTLLAREAGIDVVHVPYKGVSVAIPDLISQRVDFLMGTATSFNELIKSGRMRPLAVSTAKRSAAFPDVPCFKELGYPGAVSDLFIGMVAPAGTPIAVRRRLADAMLVAKSDAKLVAKFAALGQELSPPSTPEQFDTFLREQGRRYRKIIAEAGIKAD